MANETQAFLARNLSEFFYQQKTVSTLVTIGSGTTFAELPQKFISTRLIPDLCKIQKHERHINFGPGVTLAQIMALGRHRGMEVLFEALKSVANPYVRNIATIGGNVAAMGVAPSIPPIRGMELPQTPPKHTTKLSLYAPLMALDTQLEFLSPNSSPSYTSLQKFKGVPEKKVLTNIRVPLNDWDVSLYKRLGPKGVITEESASFAFLVASEKSIVTSIRMAFSGVVTFRATTLENRLLGMKLPLTAKQFGAYIDDAMATFDETATNISYQPILRQQFLHLVRFSLEQLT